MSLRMLAPAALAGFAVVFLIVVVASLDDDSSERVDRSATRPRSTRTTQTTETTPRPPAERRVYVVRPGDTLSTIAAKTGIEIEQLLVLNPSVDPQGLVTGQRIKLRE